LDEFQPIPIRKRNIIQDNIGDHGYPGRNHPLRTGKRKNNAKRLIFIVILVGIYFLAPLRSNILILGTDYLPHRESLSRTDANILLTVNPLKPYVGMLSIPRDLWVFIPGYGENRINTAYFFAEAGKPGSGPSASLETIQVNFGLSIKYYLVIKMEGVVKIIDAMGGVAVDLPTNMGGLKTGLQHLDGTQALAFARERYTADDFSRMKQGQILIIAIIKKMLSPAGWIRTPLVLVETLRAVETNIPWWLVPRIGFALLRSGASGMDTRTIDREMVTPFVTIAGAQVLAPKWDMINPVLMEMFGQ
jgi:LCP family protein required for cell wall assembly